MAGARKTDPATSHLAAASMASTAEAYQDMLLEAYRGQPQGLTPNEARDIARVPPDSCFWTRCSELKRRGWITPTGEKRLGDRGRLREVCVITHAGMRRLYEAKSGT